MSMSSATLQSLWATALTCHQQGRLADAEHSYQQLLQQSPNHFDAWQYLGVARCQRRAFGEGVIAFKRAVMLKPDSADAHASLGRAYKELTDYPQAIVHLQRAIELHPQYAEALNDLGICLAASQQHAQALLHYDRVLSLRPDYVEAIYNRGNALIALREVADALQCYDHALRLQPNLLPAIHNRGNALRELKRYAEALQCYETVLQARPDSPDILAGCGKLLEIMHRLDEALVAYQRALAVQPDHIEALGGMGYVLYRLFRHEDALQCYERVLKLGGVFDYAPGIAMYLAMCCADWHDYQLKRDRLLSAVRAGLSAAQPMTFLSLVDDLPTQLQCAQRWMTTGYPAATPLWQGQRYRHERIRVAYLSADFHQHATSILMAGLFEYHDRSRFEVIAISYGPNIQDAMRARLLQAFERFIDVSTQTDLEIAQLLCTLEVDIAVDLKGYTADCRPGILARRPAPIQVSYLGYPGSMAAPYIDYLLADRIVIPEQHRSLYSEQVVYLPDSYQVNDDRRLSAVATPTRAECGLPEQGFVFCCFNNTFKITPFMFDVWMRLLQQVPGSVLWLLKDSDLVERNLRREAVARGLAADRLIFAPRQEPAAHLARHRLADLFLDTLPYNAHTTASDALWAGLPVVTCTGGSFASRVAASLLHAADLAELVTHSLEDYERLALSLANDSSRLQAFKLRLAQCETLPLFDTDNFRRHLESAYFAMWARHQRNEPPAEFTVTDIV
jgi:predicted O-linked N-acetylglucosamine transferase (SPINDLY family)